MTTPTMTIDGVEYVEAKPKESARGWWDYNICAQCALGQPGMQPYCGAAIQRDALEAFGGDCMERGVIYLRKESPAAP